tara:strand:+ start:398 stop:724 length:327 start_codon:yes stop_codon:yes gene_type:complete
VRKQAKQAKAVEKKITVKATAQPMPSQASTLPPPLQSPAPPPLCLPGSLLHAVLSRPVALHKMPRKLRERFEAFLASDAGAISRDAIRIVPPPVSRVRGRSGRVELSC